MPLLRGRTRVDSRYRRAVIRLVVVQVRTTVTRNEVHYGTVWGGHSGGERVRTPMEFVPVFYTMSSNGEDVGSAIENVGLRDFEQLTDLL